MKLDGSFDRLMQLRKGKPKVAPEVEPSRSKNVQFDTLFENLMKARKDLSESTAVADLVKARDIKFGDIVRGSDNKARKVIDVFRVTEDEIRISYKDGRREVYSGDDEVERLTIE